MKTQPFNMRLTTAELARLREFAVKSRRSMSSAAAYLMMRALSDLDLNTLQATDKPYEGEQPAEDDLPQAWWQR